MSASASNNESGARDDESEIASEPGAVESERSVPELEAEAAELKDRLLRALAEQENIRRRAQRELEEAERPAGTVAEVLQPGYLHYDRLLRPAMVGVAKSPAMAEREQNGR